MREFWNTFSQLMKPRFHEISAYLIALTCCWLFISHAQLRQALFIIFSGFGSMSPMFIALGLAVIWALLLSFVHAFIKRKKSASEKFFMGGIILGASGVASFAVGIEMLPSRSPIMMILPAWNILMGLWMLSQMEFQKYDMTDDDASLGEVFYRTVILVGILFLTDFGFRLSWAMILSICIFYSTTIIFIATWIVNYFGIQTPDVMK